MTAFWNALSGKIADRLAAISVHALVFWLGGLIAWIHHDRREVSALLTRLEQQGVPAQMLVIFTVLFAVAASGIVVAHLVTPCLRLLEGYWPSFAAPVRHRLAAWYAGRAAHEATAWQQAYAQVRAPGNPDAADQATYARLEQHRRRRPSSAAYFMPTPIGNILRAAERRPVDKYGLDTVALWPRLWLLLPEDTRHELTSARASLDNSVSTAIWGLVFCAFAPLTPLTVLIGLVTTTSAVGVVIPARAQHFGNLIEAAYDLHHIALYRQVRWPLPENPQDQRVQGEQLTAYLWRGSDDVQPTFTEPPP
ncbi:hypothetical protein [Streptomyces sp. WMMB 322]|uniref:hypothetical protein n=1 Tax=Streptomyces sp. WMMB 322 TaxID=1286821 RepID=UPI0006E3457E|nr:hypothetical protein [Streptomyces sp. WMMB 322]SCK09683.1 hypothetical protein H180DRAFT_00488 [Streptomyces sp. WMMB 322]